MAGGNLSPRQKMIGMMYLVLTALLALNISKEIVLAFVQINSGLEQTTTNFNNKNSITYADFDFQEQQNPGKVKPFHDKAKIIKKAADDLEKYIEALKREIIAAGDKLTPQERDTVTLEWCQAKDENNVPAMIMVGSSADGREGKARELKNKITEYKEKIKGLVAQIDPGYAKKMKIGLDVTDPPSEEGEKNTWEMHNFGHYPLAPVITLLSKLQSDVRNSEADAINYLYSQVDARSLKFDMVQAKVIPKSNYVFIGQDYEADVFVAAYSTTQNPEVLVGNVDTSKNQLNGAGESVPVEGGMGKYKKHPTTEGIQKWGGIINVKMPDGTVQPKSFMAEYVVAKPNAIISPEKMNVLYIGVDNPIGVSIGGGIADEKIDVSISSGSISRVPNNKGHYIAKVTSKGEAVIKVSAEVGGKKGQSMGEARFRVKDVPDPVAMIAKKKGGIISKALLSAQVGIAAELENFEFEGVRYIVTSYECLIAGKGRDVWSEIVKSNAFNSNVQAQFGKLRVGDNVIFQDVKAVGPGGNTRNIGGVSFKIN